MISGFGGTDYAGNVVTCRSHKCVIILNIVEPSIYGPELMAMFLPGIQLQH